MKFNIAFAILGVLSTTSAAPWVVLDSRNDMLAMSSEVSEVVATTSNPLPQVEEVEAVTIVPENIASDDVASATEPQPEPEVAAVVGVDDNVEVTTTQADEAVIETTTLKQEAVVPLSDVKNEDIISKDAPPAPVVEKQNSIKEEVKKQVRQSVETANKKIHDIIKKHKFIM